MLGKPIRRVINVLLFLSVLSSFDSVAKFALILSPLTIEPDVIFFEIPTKMNPILPVTKYAFSIPKRKIDTKIPIIDKQFQKENTSRLFLLYRIMLQLNTYL